MLIIDCHTHAYNESDREALENKLGLLDGSIPQDSPHRWRLVNQGGLEALAESEKEAGVDRFVLLPVATRKERVGELNRWSARAAEDHPGVIPFATLHPLSADPEAELEEALKLDLKGVKLHSLLQRFDLLSEESLGLLEKVDRAGLPLLLDTLYAPGLIAIKPHLRAFEEEVGPFATSPPQVAELAATFPGLTIIAAHMGCLYGWSEVRPLYGLDNVYFDLAYVDRLLEPGQALKMIRKKGADRVLWGTDTPWREVAPALAWFRNLDLDQEAREAVLGGNMSAVLGGEAPVSRPAAAPCPSI